jgi:hypothetical protein
LDKAQAELESTNSKIQESTEALQEAQKGREDTVSFHLHCRKRKEAEDLARTSKIAGIAARNEQNFGIVESGIGGFWSC